MKKILFTQLLVLLATISFGQINYHDINPDTTVNTWNAFVIQPTPGSTDIVIWWHPSPEVVIQTHGNAEILFETSSALPAKLNAGDSIAPSGHWIAGDYDALSSGGTGNWVTNATDKYIGFRFKNSGNTWYYGWLKMSVGAGASSFTVKEWAYNTTGSKINAGQVGTTGISTMQAKLVTIYPNPAKDYLQLKYDADENTTMIITNATGTTVTRGEFSKGMSNPIISLGNLAPGTYHIVLSSSNSYYTNTFIKQ
ncbi:MAG: T9SS type A sorting domain-containing protein [Flavipsychrobacter sp.]